jgi:hypothetical protein
LKLQRRGLEVRIEERTDKIDAWCQVAKQSEPLRLHESRQQCNARHIAAWPIKACDQTELHGIAADPEHDRDRRGRSLRCERRRLTPGRHDNRHLPA